MTRRQRNDQQDDKDNDKNNDGAIYRVFFKSSAQIFVLKRKTLYNQRGYFVQ